MNFEQKNFEKKNLKFFQNFFFFAFLWSKSRNGGEITNLMPETESRNTGDKEL